MVWMLASIALSAPAVYYGSNAVRDLLFEVRPLALVALATAAGTLALIAFLSALLPARRAASIQPSAALSVD